MKVVAPPKLAGLLLFYIRRVEEFAYDSPLGGCSANAISMRYITQNYHKGNKLYDENTL